jgi:hypothetical protein
MTGAVLQLKLKGTQDKYLTSNPEVSFFKKEYKRFANFSVEQTKVYFQEHVDFGKRISVTLPKRADMLSSMALHLTFPKLEKTSGTFAGWTNSVGHAVIDTVELEIGNRLIDKHFGVFLEIWDELTSTSRNENILTGKISNSVILQTNATYENTYVIPFKFWFCRGLHTALPLLNLMYQDIKIIIKLRPFSECVTFDGDTPPLTVNISESYLLVDFIYLDDMERMIYKQDTRQVFLIEQLQIKEVQGDDTNNSSSVFKTSVPFNHPVKELIWFFIEEESLRNNDWFNFSQRLGQERVFPLMKNATLLIDGKEREEMKDEIVYRVSNTARFHRNVVDKHFYCISFCDKPEDWQPSGSLNFSKIDDVILHGDMNHGGASNRLVIFGINFNWLAIENGQSSVLFLS